MSAVSWLERPDVRRVLLGRVVLAERRLDAALRLRGVARLERALGRDRDAGAARARRTRRRRARRPRCRSRARRTERGAVTREATIADLANARDKHGLSIDLAEGAPRSRPAWPVAGWLWLPARGRGRCDRRQLLLAARRSRGAARSRRGAASSSTFAAGSSRAPIASPKRAIASGATGRVEAQRRRQRERVHRAVREPVAAAERLRHRVGERRGPRARAPRPHEQAPRRSPVRASRSCGSSTTRGSAAAISSAPASALASRLALRPLDVERLGAVRERVHRRADGLRARQVERQLDVVDDPRRFAPRRRRPCAAARRAHAERRRPLGAGVGRRHRDDRQPGRRGDGLRGVDCRAAAERDEQRVGLGGGTSIRSDGTSDQCATLGGRSSAASARSRRAAAARGRARRARAGSSARHQRTITLREPSRCANSTNARARRGVAPAAAARGRARSRARVEPLDPRRRQRARGEVGLDGACAR